MITDEGKIHVKRYLAGYENAIAQSVAFGIGTRTEAGTDTALQLEVASSPINLTTYDFAANKIVYKAAIPDEYVGKIYEAGIYSLESNPTSADYSSRNITTFDSATEEWINPSTLAYATFGTTATRIGVDSLLLNPALSTTQTYALQELSIDLSGYSAADLFTIAYNVANANTTALSIRFMTDASNYYTLALGAQTAGYKMVDATKGSATATGTPTWENITEIRVIVTSGAGGASGIEMDAIRIQDVDTPITNYILVARKVLSVPVTKVAGMSQDLEFSLGVTIT